MNFFCGLLKFVISRVDCMWFESRDAEAVNFLWKRKHLDERDWKRTRKRLILSGARSGSNFSKIRRFRIFKQATTVWVKCNNNNNDKESKTKAWYGMERKFRYGRCQNRMEDFKNGMEDNLPYQFHTRFCALYLQKNTYLCWVVIDNIVTKLFNCNIYAYCLSTNRGTLVVYIAQAVYALHHWKYIAICSINVIVDDFDRFDLFFLRLTICQVLNFVFLHRHKNSYLLFHSCFSLILFVFLVFQLTIILFGVKTWYMSEVESRTQGSRLRPRTQKKSEAKDSLSEDRHSRGQGQECSRPRTQAQVLSKKKKIFIKIFQAISKKKVFTKIFQAISSKKRFPKNFSSAPQNFNNSKNTAILEPRTGQFSRPRTSKCVLEAKDVLEDSTSGICTTVNAVADLENFGGRG